MISKHRAKHIIIVDDSKLSISAFLEELALTGFKVSHYRSVDSCLEFVKTKRHVDIFVLDIMMPPGNAYRSRNTDDGLFTGRLLAHDIRRLYPITPIVFLSNLSDPINIDGFSRSRELLGNVVFLNKVDVSPVHFSKLINSILSKGIDAVENKSLFAKIIDSLLIRPSFYGIGIDLLKLFKMKKRKDDSN
jgi:CheY-like chemotaxis protein